MFFWGPIVNETWKRKKFILTKKTAWYAFFRSASVKCSPRETFPINLTLGFEAVLLKLLITFLTSAWSGATPYLTSPKGTGNFSKMSIVEDGKICKKNFGNTELGAINIHWEWYSLLKVAGHNKSQQDHYRRYKWTTF